MQHILLLHGAIGSKEQFNELTHLLGGFFHVHTLNFAGHGGRPLPVEPFSIEQFAQEVLHYLSEQKLECINVFGYSMGGYVAMYLGRYFPGRVNKIITLATKYTWDKKIAEKEIAFLDAEKLESKIPAFAKRLKERHAPEDWKMVLEKTRDMLVCMGAENPLKNEDYKLIESECLLLLGEHDRMVSTKETEDVYNALPKGKLKILSGTHHPIEQINTTMLAENILQFIKQ